MRRIGDFFAAVTTNMTHQEYVCEGMIRREDIVTMLESF